MRRTLLVPQTEMKSRVVASWFLDGHCRRRPLERPNEDSIQEEVYNAVSDKHAYESTYLPAAQNPSHVESILDETAGQIDMVTR